MGVVCTYLCIYVYLFQLDNGVSGLKVGLLTEGFDVCKDEVSNFVRKAAETLSQAGLTVEECSIPMHKDGEHIILIIYHSYFV